MSLVRFDVHCRGIAVPAQAGGANGSVSSRLARISLRQPDLSSSRFGLDAGVLWTAVFSGADDCRHSGKARAAAPGPRSPEAYLCRIHSAALDSGGYAVCERQARFAEKSDVLPYLCRE